MKPRNLKELQERSKDLRAYVLNAHLVVVQSNSNPMANHVVTVEYRDDGSIRARCTCPWAINGGVACSHVLAALEHLAALRGRSLSFWEDPQQARRQKRRLFHLEGRQRDEAVWITSRPTAA